MSNKDQAADLGESAACNGMGAFSGGAPSHIIPELEPVVNLPDLATEAKRKAASCAALAASCRSAGDRAGFWRWRALTLRHQAIFWVSSHPAPRGSDGRRL